MVTTGFSKPYIAEYSNEGTTVTYSKGMVMGRGVSVKVDINTADDNDFYADNVIAETESSHFTSGSATLTIDGLSPAAATLTYGLPESQTLEVGSKQVKLQAYGDAMNPPYLGFGCIRETKMNGVVQYWPFILPKIRYGIASDEMNTREESIDWQTQELSATILRDDTEKHNWKYLSETGMATEAEAEAVIKAFLNITE